MKADRHAPLALLCFAAVGLSGCAYYRPHSLVATNIRTTDMDALTSGPTRVEADACGNRILWIPFGPEPRVTTIMNALHEQVTNAIGFEDIRIDVSLVNYVFPLFWQECVHGSAVPLFSGTKRPSKPVQKAPPAPAAPPQPADSGPASADPIPK